MVGFTRSSFLSNHRISNLRHATSSRRNGLYRGNYAMFGGQNLQTSRTEFKLQKLPQTAAERK